MWADKKEETPAIPKRINPGTCVNEIVLLGQFGERTNLIRARSESHVHVPGSPPVSIPQAGHRATYIIQYTKAITCLEQGIECLHDLSEERLHPACPLYPVSNWCDDS
jgi:hypothetical protein